MPADLISIAESSAAAALHRVSVTAPHVPTIHRVLLMVHSVLSRRDGGTMMNHSESDISGLARRVQTIEEAQAFDQRTLEQLHELVLDLGKRLDALQRRVRELETRAERERAGGREAPGQLGDEIESDGS